MTERQSTDGCPRIRDSILVFGSSPTRVQVRWTLERRVSVFDVEPWVRDLLRLLDGTRTVEELAQELRTTSTGEDIRSVLGVLTSEKIVTHAGRGWDDDERHSRQMRFFDELISAGEAPGRDAVDLQERLRAATVVVLGVGGAGSWVVQALAHAGVGRLVLIDPDTVELSNLGRQVLFSTSDLGLPKVERGARRVRAIDPAITVRTRSCPIRGVRDLESCLEGVGDVSLMVSCADEPSVAEASDVVADFCTPRGITHVVGGAYGFALGSPGVTVMPGRTTCWSCVRAEVGEDHGGTGRDVIKGAGPVGTSAPVCGVVGNATALEIIRVLTGQSPLLAGGASA